MIEFEMRQLEYFVAAASAGSYSQAAKMLYVSPQAVSKGVQILECRIGVSLFERGPNGIALTSFGELFKEKAEEALLSLERLQVLADQYKKERTLSLTVGIHSLCFRENGGSIDRSALLEFQEAHQTADLSFAEMKGDAIVDSVAKGRVDLGISVVSKGDFRLSEGLLLKKFPIAALVSDHCARFAAGGVVAIEELVQGELVLFSGERDFNEFFIERVRSEGSSVNVSPLQVSSHSDIDFVIDRELYVIRPLQHARRTIRNGHLLVLPIVDGCGNTIEMPLHLFWRRSRHLSNLDSEFVEFVRSLYL